MMNRIIWHHSGGGHNPNATDRRAYHRLTDGDGQVHAGQFAIEANAPGRLQRGAYAAHTLNLNSGAIGSVICSMVGGVWSDPRASRAFPRPVQVDAIIRDTAQLCRQYGITPDPRFTLTHAEVELTLGVKQRNKWDFDYDPRGRHDRRDPIAIGDELRQELVLVLKGLSPAPVPQLVAPKPILRQGSRGDIVSHLQSLLSITADGIFGPATRAAVMAFQRRNNLLPDGVVGRMTWAALAR